MKTIFFGSSKYSVIDEKKLYETFGLSLVVTLPDRLDSRTKETNPNPVKKYASANTIPVITTEKLSDEVIAKISSIEPDFLVIADYRVILPKKVLEIPKKAAINIHHSLLPKYRGPAPVPFAILAGEQKVGVTIILMTAKVDAGDMLAQETYVLKPNDTTDSVLTQLNQLGSQLAVKVIQDFETFNRRRIPQDESKATFTHYMSRQDGYINLQSPIESAMVDRMIRAYSPWPGVWTKILLHGKEKNIKLLPNHMLQAEGKKPQSYKDFLNGYPEAKEFLEKLGFM